MRRSASMVRRGTLLGVALLALVGCQRTHAAQVQASEPHIHVETAVAGEQSVPKEITLTGTLEADRRTDLAANAAGRVTATFVERGDHVTKGQLLAQLDIRSASIAQAEARANAASAQSQVVSARADCDRYGPMLQKSAITQQEYDRAMAQCQTTVAAAEAAEARSNGAAQTLGDGSIRAPYAGVIAERFVSTGDYVKVDTKVLTLIVSDPLRLKLSVPEAEVATIHVGLHVHFETVSMPGRSFDAVIRFVGGEIRETTRDMVVEAVADNTPGVLLPGMFVTAHLPVGQVELPVIPRSALTDSEGSETVFLVVDKHLQQRVVQTGSRIGEDRVSVREGLTKGDVVVTNPTAATIDGVAVD
jgi:membrane fusion protein (multidrug efflux system)